jgi:catechol 2,3-dioxygenase-like lactoylglutathione lyase family enzyme
MVDRVLDEPRFTHVALRVLDLVRSIEWYERYTPLRAVDRRRDPETDVAWLCHPEPTDHPFVVVLSSFETRGFDSGSFDSGSFDSGSFDTGTGAPRPQLGPFGHLGIELPSRDAVDAMAVLGRADGCLAREPPTQPTPVGYVCALTDPDGNVVEFSYDQGVHDSVRAMLARGTTDEAAREDDETTGERQDGASTVD